MPTTKTTPARIGFAPGSTTEGRAAQGGGELRVLLDEGALHLLEQSQLFLGERHGSSCGNMPAIRRHMRCIASLGSGHRSFGRRVPEIAAAFDRDSRRPSDRFSSRLAGRTASPRTEPGPVDRPVGVGPAVLPLPEHQLPVHGPARAPVPRPGPRPGGSGRAAGRGRRRGARAARWTSWVTSVASGRVRDRVMVVKSANRTVIVTVRPATPAARIRRVTRPESRSSSRADDVAVVGVAAEGLVGAHGLLGVVGGAARRELATVGAPGQLVEVAAEAVADRALEGAQRGVRDVADGDQAEAVQQVAGLLPHSPQLAHVERVQEGGDRLGGYDDHAVGLGAPAGQLGQRHRRGHAHRAGDALLVVDRRAQLLGDLERAARAAWRDPRTSRNASSRETASTSGVTRRKVSITARDRW